MAKVRKIDINVCTIEILRITSRCASILFNIVICLIDSFYQSKKMPTAIAEYKKNHYRFNQNFGFQFVPFLVLGFVVIIG